MLHDEQDVAPACEYEPGEQYWQEATEAAPVSLLYVPAGHDLHTPLIKYFPGVHASHTSFSGDLLLENIVALS